LKPLQPVCRTTGISRIETVPQSPHQVRSDRNPRRSVHRLHQMLLCSTSLITQHRSRVCCSFSICSVSRWGECVTPRQRSSTRVPLVLPNEETPSRPVNSPLLVRDRHASEHSTKEFAQHDEFVGLAQPTKVKRLLQSLTSLVPERSVEDSE
jgi:hypothetical protein